MEMMNALLCLACPENIQLKCATTIFNVCFGYNYICLKNTQSATACKLGQQENWGVQLFEKPRTIQNFHFSPTPEKFPPKPNFQKNPNNFNFPLKLLSPPPPPPPYNLTTPRTHFCLESPFCLNLISQLLYPFHLSSEPLSSLFPNFHSSLLPKPQMPRDPYSNWGLNLPTDESSSEEEEDSTYLEMFIADGTPKGIPDTCFCGRMTFVQHEESGENKGRAYYACDGVKRGPHFRKWWDYSVTEEVESLVNKTGEQKIRIEHLESENAKKSIEIEELKQRLLNLEVVFGRKR